MGLRANTLSNYSLLLRDQHEFADGAKSLREAIKILTDLADAHPDYPTYRVWQARAELNLAAILTDRRETPDRAEELARGALDRLKGVSRRLPAILEFRIEWREPRTAWPASSPTWAS